MAYSTIRKGTSNEDVKTWQDFLKSQNYNIATDGIFGNETDNATRDWQTKNGLTADGIVGKNTWASMNTGNTNTATQTTNNTPEIFGADKSVVEKGMSSFEGSDDLKTLETEKNEYKDKAQEFLTNTDIVDEDTKNKMNGQLSDYLSPEIAQADSYIKDKLAQIQSGKTSWTDKYNSAMNDYLNRDKFEYDVDNDQLFQQALASAMNSGKTAMQDTIGQASTLTGGYGSTYATTAGNQAYNQFIEDAHNNLPEYYQMAMEAYQMEGQEMLNRVNLLGAADDKEYGRMVDAYNVTSDYRNNLWNEGFNEWTTTTSNAINYGNFLLNENQTIGNNYKSAYDISANEYANKYTEEWNSWNREIENAWNVINYQNSDAWSQKNYDQTEKWNQKNLDYNYSQLNEEKRQFNYSIGDTNNDGVVSEEEKAALNQYDGYINPDDVEVDEYGNITKIKGYNLAGEDGDGKTKYTTFVSGFKTNEDDNFDITLNGETYKVENWGVEENEEKLKGLESAKSYGDLKVYNGRVYYKYNGKYYQVGQRGWNSGYKNLLEALSK